VTNSGGRGLRLTWDEWRGASRFADGPAAYHPGRPTAPTVIVRPNRYERGRANVAVLNFPKAPRVAVDLRNTGLSAGQRYEIRDALNFYAAPVAQGTWDGASPASVPMTGLTAAAPTGDAPVHAAHTAPTVGAFVVLPATDTPVVNAPRAAQAAPRPAAPAPTAAPATAAQAPGVTAPQPSAPSAPDVARGQQVAAGGAETTADDGHRDARVAAGAVALALVLGQLIALARVRRRARLDAGH
jgi:hypothetical protein